MPTACIALGSNLGTREAHIARGFDALATLPGSRLLARSPVIETAAVGPVEQGPFLNAAALLETVLPPRDLMDALLEIEVSAGRDRVGGMRWGPRTLDLDLLLYDDLILAEPGLTIPHPFLHERRFVLEPLAAIAPDAVHPVLRRTVAAMLGALSQQA